MISLFRRLWSYFFAKKGLTKKNLIKIKDRLKKRCNCHDNKDIKKNVIQFFLLE